MTDEDAALLAAIREMATEAKTLRVEVRDVRSAGKVNRRMIWLTIASVVLDVLISFALGWNIRETNITSDKTDAVADRARAEVCTALNERNVEQLDLWNSVLDVPPLFGETPEQAALRETRNLELQPALKKAFAPHDCPEG